MGVPFRHILRAAALLAVLVPAMANGQAAPAGPTAPPRVGPISGLPLPRFVALRAPEVNMRTGPGLRYPIEWVYTRSGLPVEVIDEFETWRRIRDWEGSVGWVHQNLLTGDRRAMVIGKQRLLRRAPEDEASGLALLEAGVIATLKRCADGWCRLEVGGHEGWLRDDEIYGVDPGEEVR